MRMASRPSIFLLDSEPNLLQSMQALFRGAGYNTRTYQDPHTLIRAIEPTGITRGAIIANAQQPYMQTSALIETLLAAKPRLPIILLAAQSDIATAVQALKSGASHFIEMPVVDRILLEEVESAMAHRRYHA